MSGKADGAGLSGRVLATEMRNEMPGSLIGLLGLAAVTVYIHVAFRPYVDRLALDLWSLAMASFLAIWLMALAVVWRRRPSDAEMLAIWAPGGRVTTSLCNVAVAASVWLLLPDAPDGLRVVMIVLYLCYLMVELSIATEETQVATSAMVMILGSVITFVATSGEAYAAPLALFLAMIGAMLLAVRRLIRRHVVAATAAHLASEESSAQLRAALAVVAAERDARTRFIRSASHDLAQPLQAARLFFDQHLASRDPAERARAADGVRRAFASTAALLDTMLMHLKLEAGAVRAIPETIDAGDFAAQLAADHAPAAREAGVRLRVPRSRIAVTADPHLLKRILGNFIVNAIRHSKGERVLIAARPAPRDRVRFWVLDDGAGVDPGLAPTLFEDFAQGDRSAAAGGFGLGLASARKLAEAMAGRAGYDPRWRGGAAFWVELPRATAPALSVSVAA